MAVSTIPNNKQIRTVDINTTNSAGVQVNSASGGKVSWTNFISGFVINTNDIIPVFYTYSNLIYVRLKNVNTMADVSAGNYTVRISYYA